MFVYCCSIYYFPIEVVNGYIVSENNEIIELPPKYPFQGKWGYPIITEMKDYRYGGIVKLSISYISVIESKVYICVKELDIDRISNLFESSENEDVILLIGMTPFGGIALWLYKQKKSILIDWIYARLCKDKVVTTFGRERIVDDVCKKYISDDNLIKENLEKNGIPPRSLFDKYMQQFTFRYLPLFEHWDSDKEDWQKYKDEETIPEFDYIEETLFDGTHDKLHDGGLMNYHQAGKPKKLAVRWHIKKSEFMAYFWFEDEEIRAIFDRFYGAHPDTKTDFMIRIDAEQNKYELALYRYGLKEPQVISESAYQLLVFKNKFEYYRSENYNQPRGAWIW